MEFMFEKLEVYQRALSFTEVIDDLLDLLKSRISLIKADQLSRASLSIPLNIAEGNSRFRPNDRRQFFTIARGSIFECVPIIQILQRKQLIDDVKYQQLYSELQIIAKMLSKLIVREEGKAAT